MIKRSTPSMARSLEHERPLHEPRRDVFWPNCDIEVDPSALPVRFEVPCEESDDECADVMWDITVSRDYVIRRRVSTGGNMVIEPFALSDFCALIIRVGHRKTGGIGVSVNLVSEDLGIEVPLYAAGHSREAALYWHAWSQSLGIPVRMLESDGGWRDPLNNATADAGQASFERSRGRGLQDRRAAFLAKRVMNAQLGEQVSPDAGRSRGMAEQITPPVIS